ncbi:MAG: response regulator [bacterium]
MNYGNYAVQNTDLFNQAGLFKVATDIAWLLNHSLFQIKDGMDNYSKRKLSEIRENIFTYFCVACQRSGVVIPDLESVFYEVYLKIDKEANSGYIEEVTELKQCVLPRIVGKRSAEAKLCRSIISVMEIFPSCCGYSEVDKKKMLAAINFNLIKMGCAPIRHNYTKIKKRFANEFTGPKSVKNILIVDDSAEDIAKTTLSLAGWSNFNISFLYVKSDNFANERMLAEKVLDLSPDIVLMDQEMPPLKGHKVIQELKNLNTDNTPVIIGNTGGCGDEFKNIGIYSNFSKGENQKAITEKLFYLS